MTISTETAAVEYAGAGTTGPFQFPFRVDRKEDLLVTEVDALGAETTHAVDVGFTVPTDDIGDDQGGEITLSVALASGHQLTIKRDPQFKQEVDLKGEGKFNPDSYERALDYLVMQAQRLKEIMSRALQIPESELGGDLVLLPAKEIRADKFLKFDSDGKPTTVAVVDVGSLVVTPFIEGLLDDTTAAAARTTLGVLFTETTPAQLTGDVATWTPTLGNYRTLIRASSDATLRTIRGLDGGAVGLEAVITNIDVNPFNIGHEDAAAGAADERFVNRGGATLTLEQFDSATYRYDATSSRWRQVA